MDETRTPPPGPTAEPAPPTGVNREHLRDYESLRRSRTDRKIAGVAGGLGRHLNIDPTVLRVLFVVAVFFGGAGLVLYVVAWLIVPEEGTDQAVLRSSPSTRSALLIAAAVVAGLILVGDAWSGGTDFFWWPVALLALVVALVLANRDRPAAPPAPGPGAPGASDPASGTPGEDTLADDDRLGYPEPGYEPPGYGPPGYAAPAYPPAAPPPPPPRADRGPLLFGLTLALVAVALGVLGSVDTAGADVADAAYPALALTIIGGMLVLGSVFGRPGGLILLGVVATGALAVTAAAGPYDYDTRQLDLAPATAAEVAPNYSVFAGEIGLDLSRVLDPENLDGRTVRVTAEAGEIVVRVPDGVDVRVDARIDVGGDIWVDGVTDSGRDPRVVTVVDGGEDVPVLDLDLDLTVGSIRVINPVEDAS